ncbi:MAG TPA: LEPR-XLL domain-containing protein, partial [Burkholderiaceae bacterium]|nr:LEPR-XLL domain-containing protein [Burkholderiaceae bacterium]
MSTKSSRDRAVAALRRTSNSHHGRTKPNLSQKQAWRIETLEPRLLLSADLAPGVERVEGAIDQPGEQDQYEFVVTEKTRLLFDGVDGSRMQWQLDDANTTLFSSRDITVNGDRFLELSPGTYRLTVDGLQDATGSYSFRLLGDQATTPLALNQPTTGTLQPGTQAALYSFTAQAGDRIYFQGDAGAANPAWTLFDPTARIVSGTNGWNDGGPFTAERSGTYWLSIEGQSRATSAVDYGFSLFRSTPAQTGLSFGQSYVAELASPGASASYSFTLDRTTQVAWDQLSASASGLDWVLFDGVGAQVQAGQLSTQDGVSSPMLLQAGSYTLRLQGQGRTQGTVQFRLLSAGAAAAIGASADLSTTDAGSRAGEVVRIDATQAGTLNLGYRAADHEAGASLGSAIDLLTSLSDIGSAQVDIGGPDAAGDVALYRVITLGGEALLMSIGGADFDARIRLFDANGVELASTNGNSLRYPPAAAGVLYVGISRRDNPDYDPTTALGGTGTPGPAGHLRLSVARTGVPARTAATSGDVPDTMANAIDIDLAAGSSTTFGVTIGDGAATNRDVDMYRVVLGAGEVLRSTTPNGTFDGYLRVFNAAGTMMAAADDSPLRWTVPATGIYYIGLSGWSNTGYDPHVAGSGTQGATGTLSLTLTRERSAAATGAVNWMLTDASGASLGSGGLSSLQTGSVALPAPGTYYLWTNPSLAQTRGGTLRVERQESLAPSSVNLSAAATVALDGPALVGGQIKTFDLHVAASGSWVFDPASPDNGLWQLTGPAGVVTDWHSFSETRAGGALPLYLTQGDYQLRVQAAPASFSLRVAPLAQAEVLAPGAASTVAPLASGESRLYRSDSAPQDGFALTLADAGAFQVKAFDAYGTVVYDSVDGSGSFHQSGASGGLFLRVTRLALGSGGTGLTLQRTPSGIVTPPGTPITPGQTITASSVQTTQPRYTFELAEAGFVLVETRAGQGMPFVLTSPQEQIEYGYAPATHYDGTGYRNGPWVSRWMPAGPVQLEFNSASADFSFTVYAAASAVAVPPGQAVDQVFAAGQTVALLRVHGTAGKAYHLSGLAGAGGGQFYEVYDRYGNLRMRGNPAADNDTQLEGEDQDYTVIVYRGLAEAAAGERIHFQWVETDLAAPVVPPAPLQLGTLDGSAPTQLTVPQLATGTQQHAEFDVTQPGWWSVQPGTAVTCGGWRLYDARWGSRDYASWGHDGESDGAPHGRAAVYLPAGHYSMDLWNDGPAAEGASLSLSPVATVALSPNGGADLGGLQPGQTVVMRIDGTSLDAYRLQLDSSENLGESPLRFFDARGARLYAGEHVDEGSGRRNFELSQSYLAGPLFVVLTLPPDTAASVSVVLQQDAVDASPADAQLVPGSWLEVPGTPSGMTTLALSTSQPGLIFVDLLSIDGSGVQPYDSYLNLRGVDGSYIEGGYGLLVRNVPAGDYRMELYRNGDYRVRIRAQSASDAAPLTTGMVQTVTLSAGEPSALYAMDLRAEDLWHWEPQAGANASGRFALYEAASGEQVAEGSLDSMRDLQIWRTGRYVLRLSSEGTQDTPFSFTATRFPRADEQVQSRGPLSATAPTDLSFTFSAANQPARMEFDVAADGTWAMNVHAAVAGIRGRLAGPRGERLVWDSLQNDSFSADYLEAGHYVLMLDAYQAAGETVTLTMTPLQAVLAAPDGGTRIDTLEIGESVWLRLPTQPGDTVGIQLAAGTPGDTQDYEFTLFSAYGQSVFYGSSSGNFQVPRNHGGDVYLRVRRLAHSDAAAATVSLTRQAGTAPDTGTSIALGLEQRWTAPRLSFEFDLAGDGLVALEWLHGNWQTWSLTGPRGNEGGVPVLSSITNGTWQAPVRWLVAGHYTMTLTDGSGDAGFIVRDLAHARSIVPNTSVAVDLAADDPYEVFDVVLDADSDAWFRATAGASTGNLFRLYDAAGNVVASGDPSRAAALPFTVPRDGHYLLVLARNAFGTLGGGALRFELAQAPRVNALQSGITQGRFLAGSQTQSYSFSVTAPTQLVLRETQFTGSASVYELVDAAGRVVPRLSYDNDYTGRVYGLAAGSYTLRVRYGSAGTPTTPAAFAFSTRFVQTTAALPPGGAANVTWTDGAADQQLQFTLEAGQAAWITPPALNYYDRIEYRVIDAQGVEVSRGRWTGPYWSSTTATPVLAGSSGTYTLQLAGGNAGSRTGVQGPSMFGLTIGQRSSTPYTLGTAVDGSLATPADAASYSFTLTESGRVWLNAAGDNYTARLVRTDVPGIVYETSVQYDDDMRVLDLAAGTYEWRMVPNAAAPGSYHLSASLVSALPALTSGQTATADAAQSRYANAWQLDGEAGEELLIDPRFNDNYTSGSWALIGPSGQTVASGSQYDQNDSAQKVRLPQSGTYVLRLAGRYDSLAARTSTVRVSTFDRPAVDIAFGTQVSASITAPGNVNQYRFTLNEATTVLLDPQGGPAMLALDGPLGNELNLSLDGVEGYYARHLAPGSYTLSVSASGSSTPSYGFRFLKLEDAAVNAGAATELRGDLPAGRVLVAQRFDVLPGVAYNLDFTTPVNYPGYFRYTLIDAYGRTLNPTAWTSDPSVVFTGPQLGPVYLLAKQYYASSGPVHFEASLRQPLQSSSPLNFDVPTTLPLVNRQDQGSYSFVMQEPGWIELQDMLAPSTAVSFDIVRPDGSTMESRNGYSSASPGTFYRYLPSGAYTLRITANVDVLAGSAQFTARRVPEAQQLDRQGAAVRGIAADAGSEPVSLWSLDARAGDQLVLTANTPWPAGWTAQLVAPDGDVLRSWAPASAATQNFDFSRPGPYLLRIVRTGPGAGAAFSAQWGTAETPQPVVSTFSAAGAIAGDTTQTYQFEITQAGLWYLDRNSIPDYYSYYFQSARVTDANGVVVMPGYDQAGWLAPGAYTLTINQRLSSSAYDFTLRRFDAGQVPLLAYGQAVTATNASVYAARAYRIDAQAGDVLQFNSSGTTGNTPRWALFNEYGQPLRGWAWASEDSPGIPVAASGPVYAVFDWVDYTYGNGYSGGMSFQVDNLAARTAATATLGQTLSGTLSAAVQSRDYTLTLAEGHTVQFDRLNSGSVDGSWNLVDLTTGTSVAGGPLNPGNNTPYQPSYSLLAGRYTLRVSTAQIIDTTYAFRLLDLGSATPLASGVVVDGRLEPSGEALSYSVAAQAGDRIYVDLRNLAAREYVYDPVRGTYRYNYTGSVTVIDPYGRSLSTRDLGDSELVAAVSGRYTIVLDDSLVDDSPLPFRLAVYVYGPADPRIIDLGGSVQAMDLVVQDVSVVPAAGGTDISSGAEIRVSWSDRNRGVLPTAGDFSDRVIVRRVSTGEVVAQMVVPYVESDADHGPLLPKQLLARSAVLRLPHGPAGAGDLSVTVETDSGNTQAEGGSSEENNRAFASFSSTLAAYANLQVSGLRIEPAAQWQAGDTVSVLWNTVNAGNAAAAGQWTERVELVNLSTGVVVVDGPTLFAAQHIAAGSQAARSFSFTWPQGLNAIGNFRLRVVVDALSQVPEYDAAGALESDNTAQQSLVVGPDLVVG